MIGRTGCHCEERRERIGCGGNRREGEVEGVVEGEVRERRRGNKCASGRERNAWREWMWEGEK